MVQTFDLIDWTKKPDTASIQRTFVYSGAFFMAEGESKVVGQSFWRILTAGLEKDVGGSLKIFSSQTGDFEKPTYTFNDITEAGGSQQPVMGLRDVCKIVTNKNCVQNICVSTSKGAIKVLGVPPKLKDTKEYTHQHIVAHQGEALHIKAAEDGFYAFSGGSDGNIFVYKVIETEQVDKKK